MEDENRHLVDIGGPVDDVTHKNDKLSLKNHDIDIKMTIMRERFKMLQLVEEPDDTVTRNNDDDSKSVISRDDTQLAAATHRWSKLRQVIRSDSQLGKYDSTKSASFSPRGLVKTPRLTILPSAEGSVTGAAAAEEDLELEDIRLMEFWESPEAPPVLPDETGIEDIAAPVTHASAESEFEQSFQPKAVTVSRIPEEVVAEQKEKIQLSLYEEQSKILDNIKRKEVNVIWREHLARERLAELEAESRRRIEAEREKLADLARQREALMGRDFRKVREELETGLQRQQGAVKENFGQMIAHEESLSRRFQVFSRLLPQPVEVRIHLLRAVKTKLRKGAYVMMLTQYDSLGGRPLSWSQIGVNGIGSLRPGITKVFKHYGRYFDRTLRVEDSCFALCPPRPMLKPSFVFVLELFELASRHNPSDRIVGWTAVPMSYESMSLIEGKIKLPFLRGEHGPGVRHFRDMERGVASDLGQWLCNGYLEVRHMALEELGGDEAALEPADFDMDYFNKVLAGTSAKQQRQQAGSSRSDRQLVLKSGSSNSHLLFPPQRQASAKSNQSGADSDSGFSPSPSRQNLHAGVSDALVLPVDKGIFRRKVAAAPVVAGAADADRDLEAGEQGGDGLDGDREHADSVPLLPALGGSSNRGRGGDADQLTFTGRMLRMVGLGGGAKSASNNGKQQSETRGGGGGMVLQRDENFIAHRNELVKQWKTSVRGKAPSSAKGGDGDGGEAAEVEDVRERGYNLQDEVFLHRQQRGKVAGVETIDAPEGRQWAAAGLEGTIVRRWQADGPRFDSEAIGNEEEEARSRAASPSNAASRQQLHAGLRGPKHTADAEEWAELRDQREMEDYSMSIAADPSRRKNLIPGARARSKLRYLYVEVFGDLAPYMFGTFEFYATILVFLFAFWMRIYVHFLAQYLYLQSVGTPVYDFQLQVLLVRFKYMSASITTSAEVGVVAMGPIANICIFLFLVFAGALFHKFAEFLPDVVSKLLAAYGVATILDPLLTLVVDLCYHNFDCASVSAACAENYVSSSCDCFNGDFIKLWYRMLRIEGSGITGLFIMLMLYLGAAAIAALILYEYLVHLHRDGRILDVWRRVNAPAEEFFLPHDYEVSAQELSSVCAKAAVWKGLHGAKRRVVTMVGIERDPQDPNFLGRFKRYVIYEVEGGAAGGGPGRSSVYRQFLMDATGMILEVFEDLKRADNRRRHLFGRANTERKSIFAAPGEDGDNDRDGVLVVDPDVDGEEEEEGGEETERLLPTSSKHHSPISSAHHSPASSGRRAGGADSDGEVDGERDGSDSDEEGADQQSRATYDPRTPAPMLQASVKVQESH